MHKEYRVVVVDDEGKVRPVGSPPYRAEGTATRVRSLYFNLLRRRGVYRPDVRAQVTDVEWVDV